MEGHSNLAAQDEFPRWNGSTTITHVISLFHSVGNTAT